MDIVSIKILSIKLAFNVFGKILKVEEWYSYHCPWCIGSCFHVWALVSRWILISFDLMGDVSLWWSNRKSRRVQYTDDYNRLTKFMYCNCVDY